MKLFISLLFTCCCMQFSTQAQSDKTDKPEYRTAIGIRYTPFGVSFKTNSARGVRSFELIGYFKDGFVGSALFYWNYTLNEGKNIRLYGGGGVQGGYKKNDQVDAAVVGVGGIAGIDYKFLHLPLNISLDWQPSFQWTGGNDEFEAGYGGIAVRLTL